MAKWPMKGLGTAVARQHDCMTHGSGLEMPNETHPTRGDYWEPPCLSVCMCICVFINEECVFACVYPHMHRL